MNKDTIEKVTHIFKSRVGLFPFAGNCSIDKKYMMRSNWMRGCREKETENHITTGACPIYENIWRKKGNVKSADDVLQFLSAVPLRRGSLDRLEKEQREAVGGGVSFDCWCLPVSMGQASLATNVDWIEIYLIYIYEHLIISSNKNNN